MTDVDLRDSGPAVETDRSTGGDRSAVPDRIVVVGFLVVVVIAVVFALWMDGVLGDTGEELVESLRRLDRWTLAWLGGVAVGPFVAATVVRHGRWRLVNASIAWVAVFALVLAIDTASEDNGRGTYGTRWPSGAELEDFARESPNGTVATRTATFLDAAELLRGRTVLAPENPWELHLQVFAEADVVIDAGYDPSVEPPDDRLRGEWRFDRRLLGQSHLIIIDDGPVFRYLESAEHVYLVATPWVVGSGAE